MLTQSQIDNAQIEIEKIGEIKSKIARDRFKSDVADISNRYQIGRDGKISGATIAYLKSGEIVDI